MFFGLYKTGGEFFGGIAADDEAAARAYVDEHYPSTQPNGRPGPSELVLREMVARDAGGQELKVGDQVVITLKVTGIHPMDLEHPVTGAPLAGHELKLGQELPSRVQGQPPRVRHLLTLHSTLVTKS
jgi:uncharacterized Zn ribbon protein